MKTIEEHREFWANVAKDNGWYFEPFYVVVYLDDDGKIVDSLSHKGLDRDYFAEISEEEF